MTRATAWIRASAARWCSAQTMERLIDPALTDLQIECQQALARGEQWRACWIAIVSGVGLFKAIAVHGSARAIERLGGMSGDERRDVARTTLWAVVAIVVSTAMLVADPLRTELSRNREDALTLCVLLIPQGMPIAIPVGLVVAILHGLRHGAVTRLSRALILALACVSGLGSWALVQWIIPESNQAYREIIVRRLVSQWPDVPYSIPRGPTELRPDQLRDAIASQRAQPDRSGDSRRDRLPSLELAYYMRWSLSCAPVVLSIFAIVVTGRLTHWRTLRWFIALAVVVGYWSLYFVAERRLDDMAPLVIAWTPNMLMLFLAVAVKLAVPSTPAAAPPPALG